MAASTNTAIPERSRSDQSVRIQCAGTHLAAVLESLDLETDERIADAVIVAICAIDRAATLEMVDRGSVRGPGGFQYPLPIPDRDYSRDR